MSMTSDVPRVVAMVVGEELGQWYFSHGMLNELFKEAEAPGEPPEGNCQSKCCVPLRNNWSETQQPLTI